MRELDRRYVLRGRQRERQTIDKPMTDQAIVLSGDPWIFGNEMGFEASMGVVRVMIQFIRSSEKTN